MSQRGLFSQFGLLSGMRQHKVQYAVNKKGTCSIYCGKCGKVFRRGVPPWYAMNITKRLNRVVE